jgi:glycine dehydrogenase subunit 2
MLTNPNTLGLFEPDILEICRLAHEAGALVYCDGANMNAILGVSRPGDMGFDVMHFNLHKTFSTPHGGGGPGAGPVGVKSFLREFLPVPVVTKMEEGYRLDYNRNRSIGRIHSFYGNFGIALRAYAYIRALGPRGLECVSGGAVLNANYLLARLRGTFPVPYGRRCMHEFVASARKYRTGGVRAGDIAKRLLDFGIHAPTVYFPLIVEEALMIEPTETESVETLDALVDALLQIDSEISENPDVVTRAPHRASVTRVDEATAARRPDLKWSGD